MFPYGHNGAFVSLPLRNSYLFGSISYSTFLILFNSGFIVPCFGLALPLTSWHYSGFGTKLSPIFGFAKSSQIQNHFSIKPNAQIRCSGCYGAVVLSKLQLSHKVFTLLLANPIFTFLFFCS